MVIVLVRVVVAVAVLFVVLHLPLAVMLVVVRLVILVVVYVHVIVLPVLVVLMLVAVLAVEDVALCCTRCKELGASGRCSHIAPLHVFETSLKGRRIRKGRSLRGLLRSESLGS